MKRGDRGRGGEEGKDGRRGVGGRKRREEKGRKDFEIIFLKIVFYFLKLRFIEF